MLRKTLILTLLLVFALAGCTPASAPTEVPAPAPTEVPALPTVAPSQPPTDAPAPLTFTDDAGRTITLESVPQRIVSLAPSNTEILFAVGAGSQVVGRDEFSDYPEEAKSLPSIGGSFGEYNLEAIVALEPDLVLAAEINTPELIKQLEDLGLTVYFLKNPTTLEEMYTNLETVARLTGQDATELVDSLKSRVAAVDEKIASLDSRVSVFYEIDASDPAKPWTYGPGTFGSLLISRAGGQNVGDIASDPYPQLSLEQIVTANPAVIILGDAMWGVTPEAVSTRAGWETIEAVKSGKVFPIDDNLISRPGPRLVDGLEQLAKLLHPELFE
ncbi:MAG: ABC transporter substrate-binding protein [Chloroflexota bacterium]|jgi:iron complex transport system substrate-binding protein